MENVRENLRRREAAEEAEEEGGKPNQHGARAVAGEAGTVKLVSS